VSRCSLFSLSTLFWDAYLKGDSDAKSKLQSEAARGEAGLVEGDIWEWKWGKESRNGANCAIWRLKPDSAMKLGLIAAGILITQSVSAMDWPNWRGPNFDGKSTESIPDTLPDELPILWTTEVGTGFSSFSVANGRVFTMGNTNDRDRVWCLDAKTGKVIWQHDYDCALDPLYYEGGPGSTPTVQCGSVFTLSKKGHAFRLDEKTGEVIWSRNLVEDHDLKLPEWSFAGSAFIDEDRVLFSAGRQGIALSRKTGKTLWLHDSDTAGYATIVPYPNQKTPQGFLYFSAKSLMSLDPSDGRILWEHSSKSSRDVNAADPIVVDRDIVVSSSSGTERLRLVDGSAPEVVWKQHDLKWYFNPGVLIGDHLYSLHGTTHRPTELTCTEVKTGDTVWAEEGFGSGGLIAAGENIIVFDLGTLCIFPADSTGFLPRLKQKILEGKCWTAPVLSHGIVYCRNAEGKVAAVSLSAD